MRRLVTSFALLAATSLFFLTATIAGPPIGGPPNGGPAPRPVLAQDDAEETDDPLSAERFAELTDSVEQSSELTDEQKQTLLSTLDTARKILESLKKAQQRAAESSAAVEAASAEAEALRAELQQDLPAPLADVGENAPLNQLEAALSTRQVAIEETRQDLEKWDRTNDQRRTRRTEIAEATATAAARVAELERELGAEPPGDQPKIVTDVTRIQLLAQMRKIQAEPALNQAELARYDAEQAADLITLQQKRLSRILAGQQSEITQLEALIAEQRGADLQYIAGQLRRLANGEATSSPFDDTLPVTKLANESDLQYADETATAAELAKTISDELTVATRSYSSSNDSLTELRDKRKRIEDSIRRVGETGAVGLQLRKELTALPDARTIERLCASRQERMREIEFKRLDVQDRNRELQEQLATLLVNVEEADAGRIRLLTDRSGANSLLTKNYDVLFNRLAELDAIEQELVRESDSFESFIRKRVLWIRSNWLPHSGDISEAAGSLKRLFSVEAWATLGRSVFGDMQSNLWLYVLTTVLLATLLFVQNHFRATLVEIGKAASKRTCRDFAPTIRATTLTVVISISWPIVAMFFGWRMLLNAAPATLSYGVGQALWSVAAWFFMLNLLRHVFRPSGLADAHFGWPEEVSRRVRKRIRRLLLVLLPLVFFAVLLHHWEYPLGHDALERIFFVASLLVVTESLYRLLLPGAGDLRGIISGSAKSLLKFPWAVFVVVVGIPLCLVALTIAGYYYSAFEICSRMQLIAWLVVALLVARGFFFRWFAVNHRRMRFDRARQRLRANASSDSADEQAAAAALPRVEDDGAELDEVSDQTERFINSGLLIVGLACVVYVLADVARALEVLHDFRLWSTLVSVSVESPQPDGTILSTPQSQLLPVSLADLLVAIVIGLVTYTAARNVPGLLQMAVLERLPIHHSSRYAIRMVARYVIVVVGTVLALSWIRVGWDKVQWLAAALTVGLGFGLQEIFANFISGLIILFERPVRIGDVVTIGDVTGTVSRIQIRATTLTDWDRKEYIVPNREFVTGRLLNWTLTDSTNRIVLRVGVAYGTDTQMARDELVKAAGRVEEIMNDPPPLATLENFGDSTLDLVLRCYLPNLDNRLGVITQLHEAISAAFDAKDIEISFPQQDINVRSLPKERQ